MTSAETLNLATSMMDRNICHAIIQQGSHGFVGRGCLSLHFQALRACGRGDERGLLGWQVIQGPGLVGGASPCTPHLLSLALGISVHFRSVFLP